MVSKLTAVSVDGTRIEVPEGMTVLSAIALAGKSYFRTSISGQPRGPLCGMGTCFECSVTIDGVPH